MMKLVKSGKKIHIIKILEPFFDAVTSGEKTFEIRKNDRDYQVGDTVEMLEKPVSNDNLTGRKVIAEITYITDYGQKDDYVVFSIVLKGKVDFVNTELME